MRITLLCGQKVSMGQNVENDGQKSTIINNIVVLGLPPGAELTGFHKDLLGQTTLQLHGLTSEAAAMFSVGQEVTIDITPSPALTLSH